MPVMENAANNSEPFSPNRNQRPNQYVKWDECGLRLKSVINVKEEITDRTIHPIRNEVHYLKFGNVVYVIKTNGFNTQRMVEKEATINTAHKKNSSHLSRKTFREEQYAGNTNAQ